MIFSKQFIIHWVYSIECPHYITLNLFSSTLTVYVLFVCRASVVVEYNEYDQKLEDL